MNDFRLAVRQLLKTPGFTLVAVLTLALGIGACAAMFGIIDAVLLKPLPLREPARVAWIENDAGSGMSDRTTRVDTLLDWRRESRSFDALAGYNAFYDYGQYTMIGHDGPRRVRAVQVTQNFLDVLGVQPRAGRNFLPGEEASAWQAPSAILSYRFWQQQFGGREDIVGSKTTINNQPVLVVGVLPASFDFDAVFAPGADIDLMTPLPLDQRTQAWGNLLFVVGRLRPEASFDSARTEFEAIDARLAAQHPDRGHIGAAIGAIEEHVRGPFRAAFLILFGAVLCVLLIACLNLSNLLLTRAQARRKETALRTALGARRWQLVRPMFAESFVLAAAGGLLGVVAARSALAILPQLQGFDIPLLSSATLDPATVGFAVAAAFVAGVACAALPALQLWRGDAHSALAEVGSGGDSSIEAAGVRKALAIVQISIACALLVAAGLLIRSFVQVLDVKLGFEPEHAVAWRLNSARDFRDDGERAAYYERLVQRVLSLSGVEAAGLADGLPLGRNRSWYAGAAGEVYPADRAPTASPRLIDRGYLQTMQIPLRSGRYFDARDAHDAAHAVIVNETMARTLWPDRAPLGQRVTAGPDGSDHGVVVGVVGDIPRSIEQPAYPEMYLDMRQNSDWGSLQLVVRSSLPAASLVPAVRAALREADPELASEDYVTLDRVVDRTVAPRRLTTSILGGFSSLALLLAGLGVYGVIAFSVGQRLREIAIRMALGSRRRGVVALIVGEGLRIATIGVGLGLVVALLCAHLMRSLLFGVDAFDVGVFVLNAAIVAAVAVLATLIPALRAARTQPVAALR
jgi:predicted permease